jgi:hypothetical protein
MRLLDLHQDLGAVIQGEGFDADHRCLASLSLSLGKEA